jgi:hypothetical protein
MDNYISCIQSARERVNELRHTISAEQERILAEAAGNSSTEECRQLADELCAPLESLQRRLADEMSMADLAMVGDNNYQTKHSLKK